MLLTLDKLLAYNNPQVLERYKIDHPHNVLHAHEAFEELMKYFWLVFKHEKDKCLYPQNEELIFVCGIHEEMSEIDDMWHTFLLFTKDYLFFCNKYLLQYFHHSPTTSEDKMTESEFEIDFSRFVSYVYDNLGEETLIKWFKVLC